MSDEAQAKVLTPRQERVAMKLRSIARTAAEAQAHLDDLEWLGAHLDDIAEDLAEAVRIADSSRYP